MEYNILGENKNCCNRVGEFLGVSFGEQIEGFFRFFACLGAPDVSVSENAGFSAFIISSALISLVKYIPLL